MGKQPYSVHCHQISLLTAIAIIFMCTSGCGRPTPESYAAALHSGRYSIPAVKELEAMFSQEAQHFITHYGFHGGPNTWNTEILLHDRYSFTMQVKVQLSRDLTRIVDVVGEPRFFLVEYADIQKTLDGTWRSQPGEQWQFGRDEWDKIIAADGDFSVVGIQLVEDSPVANFRERFNDVRRQREW